MTAKIFLMHLEGKKKFDVKISCFDCGIGLEALPAIEIHHLNPEKKIAGFSDTLKYISIKKMIQILEKDDVIVLCSNCHGIRGATFFTKYLKVILSEKYYHHPNITKKRIRGFVKKKKIINELYNGVCAICKEVGVKSLPSLSFHHLEPEYKTIKKPSMYIKSHGDLAEIKQKFIDEKLSVLCRNCHSALENKRFVDHYKEITSRYLEDFK